ncbi:complex I NDUFA9 subunit family protein [Fodinicurvata halophila]|uniref:Complex I NDUFA9 subunit family protein n=2 Tax=Fodinicurvata halophila TaxID=1419723 RepID=A0ABV8UKP9_9PROT
MAQGTVTIFGGSGFIGRYIVERLADQGWTIRVAVRRPQRAQFLKPLGNVGQIVPIPCDLNSSAAIRSALEGVDAAINLVGIMQESGSQNFSNLQSQGARLIAETAAELGIGAFVQMSAIGASEESGSEYARTKAAGEEAVRKALPDAVILRPSVVFGPEDDFFNRFAVMARLSPFLPLIGGGHTRFQPVYVGDVADAAVFTLQEPKCYGKFYELGGPRIYSFRELMELMLKAIRRKRLLVPVPFGMASIMGSVAQLLPFAPITADQVELLKSDNVVSDNALTLESLGIEKHSAEVIIPTYLDRYRPGGRFNPN